MKDLFSVEVFVKRVSFRSEVVCNLPSISFRLLEYPIQYVHITDDHHLSSLQAKIQRNPKEIECLTKLVDSKGNVSFYRGKSCLFSADCHELLEQLTHVPLYIAVADVSQLKSRFIGSAGIPLHSLLESIIRDDNNAAGKGASVKGSFYLKNLMGKKVGKVSAVVKLFHYGKKEKQDNLKANKNVNCNSYVSQSGESEATCGEMSVDDFISKSKHTPYPPPLLYFSPVKPEIKAKAETLTKPESKETSKPIAPSMHKTAIANNYSLDEAAKDMSMFEGGYDPKKFDLIRAVLMELTYLTDFLDTPSGEEVMSSNHVSTGMIPKPKTQEPSTPEQRDKPLNVPKRTSPRKTPVSIKHESPHRRKMPFGLTNSYILRLAKLGPDKMQQTLSKFLGPDGASCLVKRYFKATENESKESPAYKYVEDGDNVNAHKKKKPEIKSTECQTDPPPVMPTLAWQPVYSTQTPYATGTVPFGICPGYDTTTNINTNQSTGSLTMAQVIQAMQAALTQTTQFRASSPIKSPTSPEQTQIPPTRSSRASILRTSSKLSNAEYNYSDNFEEPSSVGVKSRRSSLSRAATSRVSIKSPCTPIPFESHGGRSSESSVKRPTKNTRYQRGSVPSATHESTSPTTSTNSTVNYNSVFRRDSSKSQRSQTSLSSENLNKLGTAPTRKVSSESRITNDGRESPSVTHDTVSLSPSTSVDTVIRTPSRPQSRYGVHSATPSDGLTREISEHLDVVSDHSSLQSSSIHIGGSDSDSITEVEEEDPLKLSYLLSTESIQFSDEDQPTSLLKLCSVDEAKAANQFMYTY